MSRDRGGFLGRLATRGAASAAGDGGAPALRPDPWRGREMASAAGWEDPAPAAGEPASIATASHATPAAAVEVAPVRRPPGLARPSAEPATTAPAPPPYLPSARTDQRAEPPGVAVDGPDPFVMAVLTAPRQARALASAAPPARPTEPARTAVASLPEARPAPVPVAAIAPRALEPIPRVAPAPSSSEPEGAGAAAVDITIGRIELRNAPAPMPPRAAAPMPAVASGFAAYARLRAGIHPGRR